MLRVRSGPRMTMVTGLPASARNSAAWPAELPPPTTTTGRPGALAGLDLGGRVVHALALEVVEAVDVESPVARAGGDDHGAPGDLGAVGQADDEVPGLLPQRRWPRTGLVRCGAELLRLHERPLGEVAAGDAGREPEVVLDPRAGAGLSADARPSRRPASAAPRTRRRPRRPARPGRRRRRRGRSSGRGGCRRSSPRYSASSPGVGRRKHRPGGDHDRQLAGRHAELAQQRARRRGRGRGRATRGGCGCGRGTRGCGATRARTAEPTTRMVAAAPLQQHRPAGDERGEDRVAQARAASRSPAAASVHGHDDHLAGLDDPGRDEHSHAGQQVQLAQEAARRRDGR